MSKSWKPETHSEQDISNFQCIKFENSKNGIKNEENVNKSKLGIFWPFSIDYHKTSSISRTKSQNLNVSCLLLQWSAQSIEARC